MREQENARLVQQVYQNVKAGAIQSVLNFLAEDVQWQLPEMENVPFAGSWQGRQQVGSTESVTRLGMQNMNTG